MLKEAILQFLNYKSGGTAEAEVAVSPPPPKVEGDFDASSTSKGGLKIITIASRPPPPTRKPKESDDDARGDDANLHDEISSKSVVDLGIKVQEKDEEEASVHNEVASSEKEEEEDEVGPVKAVLAADAAPFIIPEGHLDMFSRNSSGGKDTGIDFKLLGEKLRIYTSLIKRASTNKQTLKFYSWLEKVESNLFPWIKPSFKGTSELLESFHGDGIVVCIGNGQARMAAATLKMIRQVHGSDIAVEVFYIGDGDLSVDNRQLLEAIPFTKTRDITKIFSNDHLRLSGWAIKPFALLASSFQNAMLIDADVVFLQSPGTLFSSRLFTKHHALFFHDRTLYSHGDATMKWFQDLIPEYESHPKELRVFNGKTAHEQESGVVVVNKKVNMAGLLSSCTLNVDKVRSKSYDFVFGDKETFWLGFETVSASYRFNGKYPGTLGVPKKVKGGYEICGRQILHVDEKQVPAWINGGIQESKYDHASPLVQMESYVTEPGEWTLHEGNVACLVVSSRPTPFSKLFQEIVKESGDILLETLQ